MAELIRDAEFWVAIAFVAFFAMAGRTLLRVTLGWLDGKGRQIDAEIRAATALKEEAEALLQQAEKKLARAGMEAADILSNAQEDAKAVRSRAEADLKETLSRREAQIKNRLHQMEVQATAELRRHLATLTVVAAERVLKQELDATRSTQLTEQAIADLTKAA